MLEIKPYENWSAGSKEQDPVEKLKGYTDYVRSGYFKAGALTPKVEEEIKAGAVQRLQMDGLINDETPEEEKANTFNRVLSPRQDSDSNARFVLDHLRNDHDAKDPRVSGTNVDTLSKYLSLKQTIPAEAAAMQGSVDEILKDKELVKRARISAVDRGDFDVIAVDSENGRQLYSSPNAKAENVRGSVDTLLKSGAISTSDLNDVADLTKSVNGGLTTNARLSSYAQFDSAVSSIAKGDKDIGDTINTSATALTEAKRKAQLSTGETILEGAKAVVAYPFDLLGKGVMLAKDAITGDLKEEKPAKYTDLNQALSQNKAFTDKYSPEDLKRFSEDYVTRRAAPAFDADKPETGIATDSMGNTIIADALLAKKDLFEKALAASPLNEEQKQAAQVERKQNLELRTPELKKLILSESSEAVTAYAKAKAAGQSDSDFVESWLSDDKNYDGFNTRLKQFGMSTFKTVAELPLGIAALVGNEGAAKALGALSKDQADRQEYSRLFGDEYGIGFQLINVVPQVGTDIAATIGTAGAFAGIRSLAKGGAIAGVEIAEAAAKAGAKVGANASTKTILRSTAMSAVADLDEVGVAAGKAALAEGGEAVVGDSLKQLGVSLANKFEKAAELTPVFATSFLRSASSSYGSIYNQLPEEMGHKEKHEKAFGYAVGSGLSTAVITAGMSFLGKGGVEDLATSRVRGILAGESEEALVAAGKKSIPLGELNYKQAKLLYESVSNEGKYVKDKVFQKAMTEAIGSSYKKFVKGSLSGFSNEAFEETLDQAIQIRIEDAALDKNTPLVERVNQLWDAGIVGGLMGGAATAIESITPITKSDRTMALAARTSALDAIATRLSDSKSPATSEIVQRIMDDAKAEYDLSLKEDQEAQKISEESPMKTAMGNDLSIKPVKFDSDGQGQLALGDEPKKTEFLGDFIGKRAAVSGYTGTLELDENNAVRLALDNVHDDGVSHMTVGPRFMTLDKSTATLDRNTLSSLSADNGTIKAGTPIIVPDTSSKEQYAFPDSSDNVSSIKIGDADALVVKGTKMVGREDMTQDVTITDPDQIQDTLSHYKLDLKDLEPKQGNVQLDLDLFRAGKYGQVEESGKYGGEFDQPSTFTEVPDSGKYTQTEDSGRYKVDPEQKAEAGTVQAEAPPAADEDPSSPTALVRTRIGDSPLLDSYVAIADNGFKAEEIGELVGRTSPAELKELDAHLRDVGAFARGLGDEYSDERSKILSSLSSLKAIHDRIKVAFITPEVAAEKVVATDPEAASIPEVSTTPEDTNPPTEDQLNEQLNTTNATIEPAATPAPAASPARRRARAASAAQSDTGVEGTSDTGGAATRSDNGPLIEDAGKRLLAAAQEQADLRDAPVVTGADGKPATIETVENQLSRANEKIAALKEVGAEVPPATLQLVSQTQARLEKAKTEIEKQDTKLSLEIEQLTAVDPTAETDESRNRDHLLNIITGAKAAPVQAIETAAKVVVPTGFVEHPKYGFHRNETESNTFAGLAEGGFLISNWESYGFAAKGEPSVNGLALNQSRGQGLPAYQVELKQRLLAAVQEKFPFIDPPAKGVVYRTSEAPVGRMDASGSAYLKLPFLADKNGNITQGFFTNNPQITAAQIDKGKEIFVPKKLLNDPAFALNKSIDVNEETGQVNYVKPSPNHTGVYGAGDVSMVGTTGYTQRGLTKVADLGAMLVEPAATYLNGVGPSARNVSDRNSTYQTLMNDAVSAGELYTDVPLGDDGGAVKDDKQSRFSKNGYLLLRNMNLTEDSAEQAIRTAQIKYSHAVKEYGLATLIDGKLQKLKETNPSATVDDLPLVKIILQNSVNTETKKTPNKADLAAVLKANGFDGGSPDDVIADYGRYLYESKGNETYSQGAPSFTSFVIKAGVQAKEAQRRRFTVERNNKSFSIDAASMDASESKSAFAALSSFIDQNEDVRATVIRSEESALDELVGTIQDNDGAYELLHGIVRKYGGQPDLNPNIEAEDLIDLASRTLRPPSNSDAASLARAKSIAEGLSGPDGLLLANKLIQAGWLPPVGKGDSVAPSRSRAVTPDQRAAVMVEPTSPEAIRANIAAVRKLALTTPEVQLSLSDDVTLLAGAARKMNIEEANRLGIRSGDTESVVAAIEELSKSGKAQHKRVAALLSQFPELIRDVNFQIMDFNDVRFAGAFMPKSNLVVVNISGHNGRGLADVILHEFLHAATFQIMSNPRTPMQVKAMERIRALRTLTQVQADKLGMDSNQFASAFGSDTEFLAYALTDVKFQGLVTAATPTGQRSLLSRIVDAILGLFGVNKADKNLSGPLEELIDFARMFANGSTYNIKYRSKIYADATQLASSISELAGLLKASDKIRSGSSAQFASSNRADLKSPVSSVEGSEESRPISIFRSSAAIKDMVGSRGGVFKGLTIAADGTVPSQNLIAKVTKGFSKAEAELVIPVLQSLESNGRINVQQATEVLDSISNAAISTVTLDGKTPEYLDYDYSPLEVIEDDLDAAYPEWRSEPELYDSDSQFEELLTIHNNKLRSINNSPPTEVVVPESASARFTFVNPKAVSDSPELRDILVSNNNPAYYFSEGTHFPTQNNVLGFARMYTETLPSGEPATFVFEVQSDWASKAAEVDSGFSTRLINNPLLGAYETIVLKSAIADAQSRGQEFIVLPDAESAMMTERHDIPENLDASGRPTTEAGMRNAYDKTKGRLHKIMAKLTGDSGEDASFGLFQSSNTWKAYNKVTGRTVVTAETQAEALRQAAMRGDSGDLTITNGSPAFTGNDGQPKTDITGRVYSLKNVSSRELSILMSQARVGGSGSVLVDAISELTNAMPAGLTVKFDDTLTGEGGVDPRDLSTVRFNVSYLNSRVAGMTERGAKASLRSLVDHEVGHIAVAKEFTPEQVTRVAAELGNDKLQAVAEGYYSATGLTQQQIRERVAADRESGKLNDSDIAHEWLRMMVTKAATGSTYEEDLRFALNNPTLLDSVVRAIKAFVNRIRQRFAEYPTAETAAMISRAERSFRNIKKGGGVNVDSNILEGNSFGDTGSLFAALDGAPEGDRTMYSVPLLSSNPKKVDDMLYRLKMYNIPSELRDVVNNRMGAINTIASSIKDFIRDFPKMRDAALNAGVSMDDIQTLFGTTAPPLTDTVLKDINSKVGVFESTLDPTLTEGQALDQVAGYTERLKREARIRFSEQFRAKQQAAERTVTDAGFGGLVKKAVALRSDTNNFKETIGFDESNDVYLTRAYKFFTTEGWALATREGGKITVDGKVVDFDKLRSVAAEAYHEQAEAYLNATGEPFTQEDVAQRTLGMLDTYLSTLETASKAVDKVVIDSLRKDLNRFKPKKDIDSTFRALLGEIEDPLANATNTLFRVGMLSANDQFKTNFAKTAIDLGLASKEAKPDYIKWKSDSSSPTMGAMAGLWFDPKVVGVLDEVFGANMASHQSNSTKLMTNLSTVVSRLSGLAVLSKTQLGIGYWPRNAIGGYIMGAAQGIYWNPLSAKGRDSVTQSTRAAFDRLPTEKDQRAALQRFIQLNVLNDQSQGRVVQDMIRGAIGTPEGELQELMANVEEARATKDAGGVLARMNQKGKFKGIIDLAGSKFTKATEILGALDGMIDGIWKMNAYYFELDQINKHFGSTMSDSAKEEAAARKVKLTFAGHSQVIDPVKSFNRTPMANLFLPFARWKSEVFRTMANTIPLAMEEIGQGGSMARRGVRRLAGFTSTLAAAPVVIGTLATTLFRALSGDDEEGEDARILSVTERSALNEALPAWQRTHNLFSQVLGGNKIQVVDMSYILPHSQLTDAVTIISDGLRTGNGIEGSKLAGYVVNDLIGAQIAATSITQVLANKDAMDQPIYVETDSAPTKMLRLLTHYGKAAVVPSAATKLHDTFRTGQQNTKDMVIGELIGARPKTYTFGEIERRGFKNLKSAQDTSVSLIGALSSSRYMSQEDIDDTVDRHQDAMNQTQARVSKFMRTMKDLGSPESSIAASAKQASFSSDTVQSAYAGYRIAWKPNQEWANKVSANIQQSKEQDPQERIGMVLNKIKTKPDIYWVNDPIE